MVSVKKEKFYGTIKQCSSHRADRSRYHRSILCSYQIAHKYGLTKMTVDRIARTLLGEEIYQKKEHLALEHLKEEFFKLKSQGLSIHNIGIKLGLSKASSFNLARRFEGECCDSCDNCDEVIQIESIPQFCDTQIEVKSQMTVSAPAVTPEVRAHISCKEPSEGEFKKEVSVVPYKPKEKTPYSKKENSVIRLKGLQISFDASLEGMDVTIAKVLKALQ